LPELDPHGLEDLEEVLDARLVLPDLAEEIGEADPLSCSGMTPRKETRSFSCVESGAYPR